jgi:hypothetical protein
VRCPVRNPDAAVELDSQRHRSAQHHGGRMRPQRLQVLKWQQGSHLLVLALPNERVKETQGGACFRGGQACVTALRSLPWCR